MTGCHACERNRNIPALPEWDRVLVTDHWRLPHAWSALPGWLVLLPLRHVKAPDELTEPEAAAIGPLTTTTGALRDVVGCTKTYVMLFAELEGHEHLHFHVVPRMPWFTEEQSAAASSPSWAGQRASGSRSPNAIASPGSSAVSCKRVSGAERPPGRRRYSLESRPR